MTTRQDELFIKKTFVLAKKAAGWTNPNPLVGAIIVKNGKTLSTGYHKKVGDLHAESDAIRNAIEDIKGSTLYVNFEPCTHHGRTPPCTEAIIKAGIKRVVFSVGDSNKRVKGMGAKHLEEAGIEVVQGVLEQEAKELNESFLTFHNRKRPFIALKYAASLDGKIATKTGDSKWITNEKARVYGHQLRSTYQAILVGSNTVLNDDPHLGARLKNKKDPLRIVLDSTLKTPTKSQIFRDCNVLIVTTQRADKNKIEQFKKMNIEILQFETPEISLKALMTELVSRNIISILVEGGGETLGRFVDEKLVDKVYAFYAPIIIGGNNSISAIGGIGVEKIKDAMRLEKVSIEKFNENFLIIGYP